MLQIFEAEGLRPIQSFTFVDVISNLKWSPNSNFVLVAIAKRSICYVRSIYDPEWYCKIDEGMSGLEYARFAPDSNHILTVSEFNVRLTIWSIS